MADDFLVVELSGEFTADDYEALREAADAVEIDAGFGTGFGAERIIKFVSDLGRPAFENLRGLMLKLTDAHRVTGVKTTKGGVEIGSMHADDLAAVQKFVDRTLARLYEG